MSQIQKIESGTIQVKKELPSDDIIRMDYLEGWDDLSEPQQAYLCVFFDTYPKKMKACFESGITQSSYRKWKNNNPLFNKMMDTIEQIHKEELEALEYKESYTDSNVRGRFLKQKDSKPTPKTSYTYIDNSGKGTFSTEEIEEQINPQN